MSGNAQGASRLKARERIEKLLDAGSFVEFDKFLERSNAVLGYLDVTAPGEGVVTGWGSIDGRAVYLAAQDFDVLHASFGVAQAAKIIKVIDMAAKNGMPAIFVWDSAGVRVQEGLAALNAYSLLMKKLVDVSGVVPTVSVVGGDMLGSSALLSPLTNFTVAIEKLSALSLKPPTVIASTFGVDADQEKLIGAKVQEAAGNADFVCPDEEAAYAALKTLLSYLPSNNLEVSPLVTPEDPIDRKVSGDILPGAFDGQTFFEIQSGYAKEMRIGFAAVDGMTVGVVANQKGQHITPEGCKKAARFVEFLDAFDIPILTFVDNEGVKVQKEQNILKDLAKLPYAYANAGAPMISVLVGKAIGEGYALMSNKGNGADLAYALEDAEIGCMSAEGGSIILFEGNKNRAAEYKEQFLSAASAARLGVVDDIVAREDIRRVLSSALNSAVNKRESKLQKKHGVMPL